MKRSISILGGILLTTAILTGMTLAAPSAAFAGCATSVSFWKGYNASCTPTGRHYDVLADGTRKFGSIVTPGNWSYQAKCWANIVRYGMSGYGYS